MTIPIRPPFTLESALAKVRAAEDAWNSRDPVRVSLAYSTDSIWRNRDQFLSGRSQIQEFLTGKWHRELDYRLVKNLWAFDDRRIAEITPADVERFLRRLDREGLTGRNVNAHCQALANVFEYATRADTFALRSNPARAADKRREDYSKPPDTFTAEQVMALARAAREGLHVNGGRRWASSEEDLEQQRANEQDAAIYTVAG